MNELNPSKIKALAGLINFLAKLIANKPTYKKNEFQSMECPVVRDFKGKILPKRRK